MGAIQDVREQLVADLAEVGATVHASWPVTFTAPCLFVVPAVVDQYVTPGRRFRECAVNVDVVVLAAHAPAEQALAALEELVEAVLHNTMDWQLRGVESPAPTTVTDNGADYLGTVIHLSKAIVLTPGE